MAHKYVPHTFRTGEVIEPTRVNENARTLANEFNGNLDRENLREEAIESSMIVQQSCNIIGNRVNVGRDTAALFGDVTGPGLRNSAFKTFMTEDFKIKHDCLCICSFSFAFQWVDWDGDCDFYSGRINPFNNSNQGEVDLSISTDRHHAVFVLRINGVEVSRSSNHSFLRKNDSVYLSGAHPVSAGTVTIDCIFKIVDHTTDHEFYLFKEHDILNFKFKVR